MYRNHIQDPHLDSQGPPYPALFMYPPLAPIPPQYDPLFHPATLLWPWASLAVIPGLPLRSLVPKDLTHWRGLSQSRIYKLQM